MCQGELLDAFEEGDGMAHKPKVVLGEYKRGTLRSGSGVKVRSRRQAVAIALSEDRRAHGKRRRR